MSRCLNEFSAAKNTNNTNKILHLKLPSQCVADTGAELLPIYDQRKCSDVSGGSDMIEAKQGYLSLRRAARKIGQVYG